MKIGTTITATAKSLHSGQSGTVIADYGSHLLIEASDQSYEGAHNNSGWPLKVFQVDSRLVKVTPCTTS